MPNVTPLTSLTQSLISSTTCPPHNAIDHRKAYRPQQAFPQEYLPAQYEMYKKTGNG